MKKHNFEFQFLQSENIMLGLNYRKVKLPKDLFLNNDSTYKGHLFEIGLLFCNFAYLFVPDYR